MNVDSQQAENIYNVNGNFVLEGTAESVRELQKATQTKLSLINSIIYFDLLDKSMSSKLLLERTDLTEKINEDLKGLNQLLIYGEPGIGKTSIIYTLIKRINLKVVYISVKQKSELSIILHLLNRILAEAGSNFITTQDIEEACGLLQAVLAESNLTFIIDDCEQNTSVTKKILSLEKFNSKFIYLSRYSGDFLNAEINAIQIPALSETESREFLKLHNTTLGTVDFNELYYASQGNPLYLYYFAQHKIRPLPRGVINYQNSIWSGLNDEQREILSYVALCHFNPDITEISGMFPKYTPLEFIGVINKISDLLLNKTGALEIFHLSFKEHIISYLTNNGLLETYSRKLGNYFIENNDLIQASYLLVDIEPELIQDYILSIFPAVADTGELRFALKLLSVKLRFTENKTEKGYIHYHMSNMTHLLGEREQAMSHIDTAIGFLEDARNKQFLYPSQMVKAMNLAERGQIDEAKELADKVFKNISSVSKSSKAVLLVNLSKIYVDLFEFSKAAKASKEAYEIFSKLKSKDGMLGSLVNLVSSLSQLDGYLSEAENYATKILEIIDDNTNFTVKIIAMNVLTSVYRRLEDFEKAKYYGSEVIKLCQKYELKEKTVMNLVNYGNIIRDEGDLPGATAIYDEAMILAKDNHLWKDVTRISWIKASVSRELKNFEQSITYAEEAIDAGISCGFYYGVAHGWQQKANALIALGRKGEAAEAYENSANYYEKIEGSVSDYFSTLFLAINNYYTAGNVDAMTRVISKAVEKSNLHSEAGVDSNSLFTQVDETLAIRYFELLVDNYFKNNNIYNICRPILTYLSLCEKFFDAGGKESLQKVINIIIDNIGKKSLSIGLLGLVLQQAGKMINLDFIVKLGALVSKRLPLFSIRIIDNQFTLVTSVRNRINLEFHCLAQDLVGIKASLLICFLIHQFPELLTEEESFVEHSIDVIVEPYDSFLELIKGSGKNIEYPFSEIEQSITLATDGYGQPIPIVLSPDFEENTNLTENANNKSLFYFITVTIGKIKADFYHRPMFGNREERKIALETIGRFLDYETSDSLENNIKFSIDIQKLSEEIGDA